MLNTPVLFLVFNRLETTKQVFAQIRKAQPRQLFIGADGARVGKEGEAEKVQAVRQYILDNIDWDCEVKTLFREQNLGCGKAVSEAITWFFDHAEQGIILEDDTLPDLSFFPFCEELLEKYKDNADVMMITAYCKAGKMLGNNASYSFINGSGHIWGWATWRRTWKLYDFSIEDYLAYRPKIHNQQLVSNLDDVFYGKLDTWDYQLGYLGVKYNKKTICSNYNLTQNLGFASQGTHTTNWEMLVYEPTTFKINFPIKHPTDTTHNEGYLQHIRQAYERQNEGKYSFFKLLTLKIKRYLRLI